MYTAKRVNFKLIVTFGWRPFLFFLLYSFTIFALYEWLNWRFLPIPFVPVGVIGTAVAFYVGFKNNSSYERLWEARRIWGSIVNASRSWAIMVLDYPSLKNAADDWTAERLAETKHDLIYYHLAYITALRVQLRQRTVWQQHHDIAHAIVERISAFKQCGLDKELSRFLDPAEIERLIRYQNPATQLVRRQSEELHRLREAGLLSSFHHVEMERLLVEFYNQQGACERIKSFPFPRQYAFFSYVFVWLFLLVLPFGLLSELVKASPQYAWLMVPIYVIIAWMFNTMEIVGDTSENPFENSLNDVPLTAICRNIEIDLREMLGETNIPKRVEAVDNILM